MQSESFWWRWSAPQKRTGGSIWQARCKKIQGVCVGNHPAVQGSAHREKKRTQPNRSSAPFRHQRWRQYPRGDLSPQQVRFYRKTANFPEGMRRKRILVGAFVGKWRFTRPCLPAALHGIEKAFDCLSQHGEKKPSLIRASKVFALP